MLRTVLLIALGGGIGSVFRYSISLLIQKRYHSIFPVATFLTNIIGCLLIGLLFGYFEKNQIGNSNLLLFLMTGFCGSFTTFSAFALEYYSLLNSNAITISLLYIGLSIFLGLLAVWIGISVTK